MYFGGLNKNQTNMPSALGMEMQGTTQYTPGPGSYNVTNGFDQINRDMQSAKTLQGFGLDEFGV